jgi:two-component system, chemotaxis family, sensor kinase CheA
MATFDINKYRQMFLEEAEDIFNTIDTLLLDVEESNQMDTETINSLFRSVHTLKGNSASVELSMFAALAHEIEFFMDRIRSGELKFIEGMASLLMEGIDVLKEILELELSEQLDNHFYTTTKKSLLQKLTVFSEDAGEVAIMCEDAHEKEFGLLTTEIFYQEFGLLENDIFSDDEEIPESLEDYFGFFDDEEPVADDEDMFGFFDEDDIQSAIVEDSFGFFDDEEPVADDEDMFGFFDDIVLDTLPTIAKDGFGFSTDTLSAPEIKIEAVDKVIEIPLALEKDTIKIKVDHAVSSIRVDLSKIDELMNNIGELVIAHSMLTQYTSTMEDKKIKSDLSERLDLIDRHIRELQESVMSVRMVPMETVFSKFPRIIRDTAKKLGKKIDFRHTGESVEIDKAMIEGLTDPLMHIVRNAMDHGIESTEDRKKVGKSDTGILLMSAEQSNGQMIIKIQDDGSGINIARVTAKAIENGVIEEYQAAQMTKEEKAMLIFAPGLSTAEAVTDISGRGVGMDVVMSNIKKLGGVVKVETEDGYGTTLTIALPLTLAILDGLNVRVGEEQFILPLSVIIESLNPAADMIKQIGDKSSEILMLRNEFIPIIRLHSLFAIKPQHHEFTDGLLIVVRSGNDKVALFVDEFMNQQQFVIKPLDKNFRNARGIGGATVRGDGTIGLILDTMNILERTTY